MNRNRESNKFLIYSLMLTITLLSSSGSARADFVFSAPENLGPIVNSPYEEGVCDISSDGLELYFECNRPGTRGDYDIWMTTRDTITASWDPPHNLGAPVNGPYWDYGPFITRDGLTLYFSSNRPGGSGGADIYFATRARIGDPWGQPVNLGPTVNGFAWDQNPSISADGLSLYFGSNREKIGTAYPGSCYLYVTTRATANDPWSAPVRLGSAVNPGLAFDSDYATISEDNLSLYLRVRDLLSETKGLRVAMRESQLDSWSRSVDLGLRGGSPRFSTDGSTMYFCSRAFGGYGDADLFQVPILPVVDFNGDGKVDGKEVLIMTESWNQDDPLCDIGPTPMGDDIVDLQDVIALTEYIGKEVDDPTLIAHWALDETEGFVASDCARENDAFLSGNAIWHPDSGVVGGAIELDGVDDCVLTQGFMNPADQHFSVLAWIKGGAPGQTIISQSRACDWLCLDPIDGSLISKLSHTSWNASPLSSGVVITDGQWHRIGLIWDGVTRALYVDEQEVARDGQPQLVSSENGLIIGSGAMSLAGTYFGGMIDDVRIYNRVVRP